MLSETKQINDIIEKALQNQKKQYESEIRELQTQLNNIRNTESDNDKFTIICHHCYQIAKIKFDNGEYLNYIVCDNCGNKKYI